MTDPAHYCHATACPVAVPPKFLMCRRHWRMVPAEIQRAVWEHYRPGQEVRKDPTAAYVETAQRAIAAVAHVEAQRIAKSKRAAKQTRMDLGVA